MEGICLFLIIMQLVTKMSNASSCKQKYTRGINFENEFGYPIPRSITYSLLTNLQQTTSLMKKVIICKNMSSKIEIECHL